MNIDADEAAPATQHEIIHQLFPLLKENFAEGFLGLIDEHATTFQIAPQKNFPHNASMPIYWVEIPHPEEAGSYGAELPEAQLLALLHRLQTPFTTNQIPGAHFQPWNDPGSLH